MTMMQARRAGANGAIMLVLTLVTVPVRAADPVPPVDYAAASSWLCRPGALDACAIDITATTLRADGTTERKSYPPTTHAPIDCFYVYPTVSRELKLNSDLTISPELRDAVKEQFVRFGTICRLFAPVYRQVTVAGLMLGGDRDLAYGDVRAAWNFYLDHDNGGRGVVLIGHSQGATVLTRLTAEEIDGKPIQARLIAAILPGTPVAVPIGQDVGGTFAHIPLCRARTQTGCAIAYSSYLASAPPGADARFGASPCRGRRAQQTHRHDPHTHQRDLTRLGITSDRRQPHAREPGRRRERTGSRVGKRAG